MIDFLSSHKLVQASGKKGFTIGGGGTTPHTPHSVRELAVLESK
jgi:hypothetical protein